MRAVIIHNPSSGMTTHRAALDAALNCLRELGWQVNARETEARGDATRLGRQAAEQGYDAAFAMGGDGTLNEVLNGVLNSETAVGVLPLGTANVWALEMGLPLDNLARAAQLQAEATPRAIDVGIAKGEGFGPRAFLLSCGAGLDAAVISQVENDRDKKRRFGKLFFLALGAREALQYRGRRVRVKVDGITYYRRVLLALTSNTQLYGAMVRLPPAARVDDGLLDVTLLHGDNALHAAWHFARLGAGFFEQQPDIEHYRGRAIEIRGDKLPVHVDAEPVGTTPVQIRVKPRALRVLVPETANRNLFDSAIVR
ncbi:MAG: diacylglycerol kinase family lipid kinase [Chloroflexota bacterium]|nr:MAG: diacylglycerol kinase family lipid kinase [Chloroflexota bacterium]